MGVQDGIDRYRQRHPLQETPDSAARPPAASGPIVIVGDESSVERGRRRFEGRGSPGSPLARPVRDIVITKERLLEAMGEVEALWRLRDGRQL
jgi:hypothetical protein